MYVGELKEAIDVFEKRLCRIEVVLREVFKKKELGLTIKHCEVREGDVIIKHSDIPEQRIPESIFDDIEMVRKRILENIDRDKREKRIYELKWQIDYWRKQTSDEFIKQKKQFIGDMEREVQELEGVSKGLDGVPESREYFVDADGLIKLRPIHGK